MLTIVCLWDLWVNKVSVSCNLQKLDLNIEIKHGYNYPAFEFGINGLSAPCSASLKKKDQPFQGPNVCTSREVIEDEDTEPAERIEDGTEDGFITFNFNMQVISKSWEEGRRRFRCSVLETF